MKYRKTIVVASLAALTPLSLGACSSVMQAASSAHSVAADQSREERNKYEDAARPHKDILRVLWKTKSGEKTSNSRLLRVSQYVDKAAKLESFAANCDEWREVEGTFDPYLEPKNACDLAENWKKYAVDYVTAELDLTVADKADDIKYRVESLPDKGRMNPYALEVLQEPSTYADKMTGKFEPIYAKLDAAVPADAFEPVVKATEGWKKAAAKAGETNRWPEKAKYKDADIEKAASKALKNYGDAKLVHYGLAKQQAEIERNPSGRPLHKSRRVLFAARFDGEDFCRIYDRTAVAKFDGTKYMTPVVELDDNVAYLISKCP